MLISTSPSLSRSARVIAPPWPWVSGVLFCHLTVPSCSKAMAVDGPPKPGPTAATISGTPSSSMSPIAGLIDQVIAVGIMKCWWPSSPLEHVDVAGVGELGDGDDDVGDVAQVDRAVAVVVGEVGDQRRDQRLALAAGAVPAPLHVGLEAVGRGLHRAVADVAHVLVGRLAHVGGRSGGRVLGAAAGEVELEAGLVAGRRGRDRGGGDVGGVRGPRWRWGCWWRWRSRRCRWCRRWRRRWSRRWSGWRWGWSARWVRSGVVSPVWLAESVPLSPQARSAKKVQGRARVRRSMRGGRYRGGGRMARVARGR
jgi:hypothetical protein